MGDEEKVSRMLLHVHVNSVTLCVCMRVSVCMPLCDGWRQLACAELRGHACKHAI